MDHTQEVEAHMLGHSVGYHGRVHPYQVPGGVEGDHNSHHCIHDNHLEGHLNYRKKTIAQMCYRDVFFT